MAPVRAGRDRHRSTRTSQPTWKKSSRTANRGIRQRGSDPRLQRNYRRRTQGTHSSANPRTDDGAGNDRKSLRRPQSRVFGPQSDHDFSSGVPFYSGSYSASLGCYVRCPCAFSARHLSDLHISRTAKSSANHLLRTARPTFIKARVPNQDCQIVPTPIMTQFRARWTTRHIVSANLPQRCDVLQYPEF